MPAGQGGDLRAVGTVEAEFAVSHGGVPGGEAVVVAMGKLGGREMTAASDLDLMLLYDADSRIDSWAASVR